MAAENVHLQLEWDQDPELVHPREDRLGLRIRVQRSDGSPVPAARLRIRLQAPETPWLASTDFPVVEGTTLLDHDLNLQGGVHAFQFVPPIRGSYTLSASVEPLPGGISFAPIQKSWTTTVRESADRKKNLAILLTILVVVGGISGFMIGRASRTMALAALLLMVWPPSPVKAHGSHQHSKPAPAPLQAEDTQDGDRIDLRILSSEARVGELTAIEADYRDTQGHLKPARFRLEVTQLEHDQLVFATDIAASNGSMSWQGQLFDGSTHRVTVTAAPIHAAPDQKPARAERDLEVTGVAPPLLAVVKSLGFLLLVTAAALLIGILMGRLISQQKGGLT
jgi:hypothetical protein